LSWARCIITSSVQLQGLPAYRIHAKTNRSAKSRPAAIMTALGGDTIADIRVNGIVAGVDAALTHL